MKLTSIASISGLLALTLSVVPSYGAQPEQELPPMIIRGHHSKPQRPGEVDSNQKFVAELIDMPVYNYQNQKLGHIKAITADIAHSRLVEVLVATNSGFMGIGERVTPVPPSAFSVNPGMDIARINVSLERFTAAPKLTRLNSAVYGQPDRAAESSRYFGVKPWYAHSGSASLPQMGYVQTTADLELMQIKNPQGHYLGKVGMVFMDLPKSSISKVVDDTESMDGSGSHILPRGSLSYSSTRRSLVLNESFAQVNRNPHFRWVNGNRDDVNYIEELANGH